MACAWRTKGAQKVSYRWSRKGGRLKGVEVLEVKSCESDSFDFSMGCFDMADTHDDYCVGSVY